MKILYFDCSNGISGDMLFGAAADLSGKKNEITENIKELTFSECGDCGKDCGHVHGSGHSHGRSYAEVKKMIEQSPVPEEAKEYALRIYSCIAKAEADVHGATLETVHFHEVGRDEAVKNALATGMAVEAINPDRILVSPIYDGHGSIVCSHGRISVPVPAVKALMKDSGYIFETADINTEMVTPSGLAGLMGIGAEPAERERELPGKIIKETEARGMRNTGLAGLKAYIIATDE